MFARFQETKDTPEMDVYVVGAESPSAIEFYTPRGEKLKLDSLQERYNQGSFHKLKFYDLERVSDAVPEPMSIHFGPKRARLAMPDYDFVIGTGKCKKRNITPVTSLPVDINVDFYKYQTIFTLVRMVSMLVPIMARNKHVISGTSRYAHCGGSVLASIRNDSEAMIDLYNYTLVTVAQAYGFKLSGYNARECAVALIDPSSKVEYLVRSRIIIPRSRINTAHDHLNMVDLYERVITDDTYNVAIANAILGNNPDKDASHMYTMHYSHLRQLLNDIIKAKS